MNTTCDQIDARLTAWLLGELDEPAAAEVRTHVDACLRCRAAADAIGPTLELLREGLSADAAVPRRLSPTRRAAVLASRRQLRFPVSRILQVAALLMVGFVMVGLLLPATQQARKLARTVGAAAEMQVVNCELQELPEQLTVLHDVGGIVGGPGDGLAVDRLEERSKAASAGSDRSDQSDLSDRNGDSLLAYHARASRPASAGEQAQQWASGKRSEPVDENRRLRERTPASGADSSYGLADNKLAGVSGPAGSSAPDTLPGGVPVGRGGSSVSAESGPASFDSGLASASAAPSPVTAPAADRELTEADMFKSTKHADAGPDQPAELPELGVLRDLSGVAGGGAGGGEDLSGELEAVSPVVLRGLYGSRSSGGRSAALRAAATPADKGEKKDELSSKELAQAETDSDDRSEGYVSESAPAIRMYSIKDERDAEAGGRKVAQPARVPPPPGVVADGVSLDGGALALAPQPAPLASSVAPRDEIPSDWSEEPAEGETLGRLDKRLESKAKRNGETQVKAGKAPMLVASTARPKPRPTAATPPPPKTPVPAKPATGEGGKKQAAIDDSVQVLECVPPSTPKPSVETVSESTRAPVFRAYGVNPFVEVRRNAFSTFSIDVDTAAYTLARNYMQKGRLPPPEAVRTEEFVNFFDYAYKAPVNRAFAVYVEAAPSAFGRGLHLLKIGVKGRPAGREENRHANLVFLVDTSGSMSTPDRIGLIKESLRLLVDRLGPDDRVTIVQYDSHARLVIESVPAADKARILRALSGLQPSGSTNLEEGLRLAYEVAARRFAPGAVNRVLILSDGAANLGGVAAEDLLRQVERYRKQGVYCSVYGFGMGTYNDEMLETLANKGDGTYAFIDSIDEARRVFVEELSATMNTIASDVKIQVEFSPARVKAFRQLGYENRALRKEDFRNDQIDAGEVGSGQSATALYELELQGPAREAIGVVRVRYRDLASGKIEEIAEPVTADCLKPSFDAADVRFRLAACVAEFAEILRGSPFAEGSEFRDAAAALRPVALELSIDGRVQELLRLVQNAGGLSRGE